MTKEELRKSLDFVNEERERLQKELERKDNIINELEKWLSNVCIDPQCSFEYRIILDKIKELENDL